MIRFESDDKDVRAKINDGIGCDWHFEHGMKHKSEATIISRHFQKELDNRIESIRKQAYEDGYKDGKHHQRKIKRFISNMNSNKTGWK